MMLAAGMLAPARSATAQAGTGPSAPAAGVAAPGAAATTLTISLLTMGPGDAVWEKFGHNAIRVRDTATGEDVAYNWGMFDFSQPNFLGRFLTGDTRYWMEAIPTDLMLGAYVDRNRSVWEQELALAPAKRAELRRFLEWNAREENKFYRYDYYRDNCSTRVRDAIDRAAGGALERATSSLATGTTYRSHTRRLTRADLPVYTGIQLALGHPSDRPISAWEAAFLPTELQRFARRAVIADTGGAPVSLVLAERELFAARRGPEPAGPPNYTVGYLVAGLAVGAVVSALARPAARGARAASTALAAVAGLWGLAAGFLGTALLLAGTVTRHVFMARNENLLLVNPLLLLLAAALPFALLSRRRRGIAVAARLAVVVALLSTLALLIKAVPVFDQRNLELVALFLPPHLALAIAARRVAEGAAGGDSAGRAPSARVPGRVASRA
jgi:hypothetical protein